MRKNVANDTCLATNAIKSEQITLRFQQGHSDAKTDDQATDSEASFRAKDVTRPASALLLYDSLCSLLAGPFFPIAFVLLSSKYCTLRYRFADSGIPMQWEFCFGENFI